MSKIDKKKVSLISSPSHFWSLISSPSHFWSLITTRDNFHFLLHFKLFWSLISSPSYFWSLISSLSYFWSQISSHRLKNHHQVEFSAMNSYAYLFSTEHPAVNFCELIAWKRILCVGRLLLVNF